LLLKILFVAALATGILFPAAPAFSRSIEGEQPVEPGDPITEVMLVASDANGMSLVSTVAEADVIDELRTLDGTEYRWIEVDGYGQTSATGGPLLPVREALLAVPEGVELSLEIESLSAQSSAGRRVAPVPRVEYRTGADGAIVPVEIYECDTARYGASAFYPELPACITAVQHVRDQRIARIEFRPFRFDPASGALVFHARIAVRLAFSSPARASILPAGPLDKVLPGLLLNARTAGRPSPGRGLPGSAKSTVRKTSGVVSYPTNLFDPGNSADYLIIAGSPFYRPALLDFQAGTHDNSLNNLAFWRAAFDNFDVAVVNADDIDPLGILEDQDVKDFITYVYENWHAPHMSDGHVGYVLLVGDTETVPTHLVPDSPTDYATDRWFTAVAGNDEMPDVPIGRFCVDDQAELDGVAEKTVAFERAPLPGQWRQEVLMAEGSWLMFANYDLIKEVMLINSGYGVSEAFAMYGHYDQEVIDAINAGCIMAHYQGHGNTQGWANIGFTSGDMPALHNGAMTPLALAVSCSTAMFQLPEPSDCFGEVFVNTPGKGAVSYFGASVNSSGSPQGSFTHHYMRSVFVDHVYVLGQNLMSLIIGSNNVNPEYNLIGDPALDFSGKIGLPAKPDLTLAYEEVTLSPEEPVQGGTPVQVHANVSNLGGSTAFNILVTFLTVDSDGQEETLGTVRIDDLAAGCTAAVDAQWDVSDALGPYSVLVRLDSAGIVDESFELNNQAGINTFVRRETVYVDAANTQGPWLGTGEYPFCTIQDGVDHTAMGGTTLVRSGLYVNPDPDSIFVKVKRPLRLLGQNAATTIVDAAGASTAIRYTKPDNAVIDSLTVRNADKAIHFYVSQGVLVSNCIVENVNLGFQLSTAVDGQVLGNRISAHEYGMNLTLPDSTEVRYNVLSDSGVQALRCSGGESCLIAKNSFFRNAVGLYMHPGHPVPQPNDIIGNKFKNNITNALSGHANVWNNTLTGNYWDDYTGADCDGDGFGDTPWEIFGSSSSNFDYLPLMDLPDVLCPGIEFQEEDRFIVVRLGDGIGGPGDERLDFDPRDTVSAGPNMTATLSVKGATETSWSLVVPMLYSNDLFRGEVTAAEIDAYYRQGHQRLVYMVGLIDEAGNEVSRPTLFEEHEEQFQIEIVP